MCLSPLAGSPPLSIFGNRKRGSLCPSQPHSFGDNLILSCDGGACCPRLRPTSDSVSGRKKANSLSWGLCWGDQSHCESLGDQGNFIHASWCWRSTHTHAHHTRTNSVLHLLLTQTQISTYLCMSASPWPALPEPPFNSAPKPVLLESVV